jgi:NADH:ubiquinone oxidoreductase subunit D/NADH:ubiquinone oxidoreductase subunit C
VTEQPAIQTVTDELLAAYPQYLSSDTRLNFHGYIVPVDGLLDFLKIARDELGYDFLSSVTGVDGFPEDRMEVVYHLYKTTGGSNLELKVIVGRTDPVVPSAVPLFPGAEFQEREIWDLYGIHFSGHPDLRRILMWEGFAGHPLRKDWKEAYFEEDVKPLKSRWPEGHARRAEDANPFGNNVEYPDGFDPAAWGGESDVPVYEALRKSIVPGLSEMKTDVLIVNLGPQHPSTHGVFRMAVALDGETVIGLKPVMGYMHRNHEKIGERNTFLGNMPFTDRLDYVTSMSNNFGYALAVEKLMGIAPPERAEYIRVMMAELTRINSHLISTGFLLNDLGAFFTPVLYALEEREFILDIFEATAGSRMMCNYFRFGGVARDLPDGIFDKVKHFILDRLPRKMEELETYLVKNEIIRTRCEGIGALTAEQAIGFAASGPILRSAGVPYDIRRAEPYSIYDRFAFDIPVRTHGDVFDRFLLRLDEIHQSIRILQQVVRDMPEGPIQTGKPQYTVRVPAGEAYGRIEGPKGELGYYVVSNGKPNPARYHVRAPSFINLTGLAQMCVGQKVADVVVILGSVDIVLGEVDR